jgi:undecaprenyl-diphosphatase
MLQRNLQTLIWKFDKYFTSLVALLPAYADKVSAKIDRLTHPIVWSSALIVSILTHLYLDNTTWALIAIVVFSCLPIATVIKLIFRRNRPKTIFAKHMKVKSYSFPSSHAFSAALAGGYFAYMSMTLVASPINYIIAGLCVIAMAVIGISRVRIGAHYPTDVTGGWVLGLMTLVMILYAVLR